MSYQQIIFLPAGVTQHVLFVVKYGGEAICHFHDKQKYSYINCYVEFMIHPAIIRALNHHESCNCLAYLSMSLVPLFLPKCFVPVASKPRNAACKAKYSQQLKDRKSQWTAVIIAAPLLVISLTTSVMSHRTDTHWSTPLHHSSKVTG